MHNIGKNINFLRKLNGLSQEQLSEKLDVTRQTLSKWEQGITKPNADQIDDICRVFNVTVGVLFSKDIKALYTKENGKIKISDHKTSKKFKFLLAFLILLCVIAAVMTAMVGIIVFAPIKADTFEKINNFYFWSSPLFLFVLFLTITLVLSGIIVLIIMLTKMKNKSKK